MPDDQRMQQQLDTIQQDVRVVRETVQEQTSAFSAHVMENKTAHAAIAEELRRHGEVEERQERVIRGHNGHLGVIAQLHEHGRFISGQRFIQRGILVAVVLAAGGVLWSVVQDYIARAAGAE